MSYKLRDKIAHKQKKEIKIVNFASQLQWLDMKIRL